MSWKRGIELFDIIGGIVDDMRNTGGISSVTAVASGYEYAASNELNKGEYISITDTSGINDNLLIISATENSFIIENNIPTALEFKAYAPYFRHEKIQKASQIYSAKSGKGVAAESQKYPLVLLVHSYPQNQNSLDFDYESTFTIHIVTNSDKDYDSTQRYAINITPILIPIQEQLIQGLGDSIYTKLNTANLIDKEWTDLLYVDNNPFPDKLDGIQLDITGLEIINTRGCDVTPAPTEFTLTLSSDSNGSVTTNLGDESDSPITVQSGKQVAAYAIANANFAFSQWLDNTNVVTQNPYPFVMKNNKGLVAQFISSLVTIQDVFGTVPILSGSDWVFQDQSGNGINNNYKIICYGNSITLGTACAAPKSYPTILSESLIALGYQVEVVNVGIGGYEGSDMLANYNADIIPLVDPTRTNILIAFEFTNDLRNSKTPLQSYNNIKGLFEATEIIAAFDKKIVSTALHYDADVTNLINDTNTLLINDSSFADELLQVSDFEGSIALCDGLHPTSYTEMAAAYESLLLTNDIVKFNNNIVIKNSQAGLMQGGNNNIDTTYKIVGQSAINIDRKFKHVVTGSTQILYRCGVVSNSKGMYTYILGNRTLHITLADGTAFEDLTGNTITLDDNTDYDLKIRWDGKNGINNFQLDLNGVITNYSVNRSWAGDSALNFTEGYTSSAFSNLIYYSKIENYFEYYYNHGNGNVMYNLLDLSKNGIINNGSIVTFWGCSSDNEPQTLTKGATIYTKDSDSINTSLWIFISANTTIVIAGYTRDQYYPITSGILNGSSNIYDGIKQAGLEVNADFDSIKAEAETATFLKPGETANTIPNVIVKQ